MRFIANGPDIPDELLADRDAGNVLLFCGAGVSMARARLPGFVNLARDVMDEMGASSRNEARKLFDKTRQFEESAKVSGLVPTDQIFGLLEHEFDPAEIQEAVARKLWTASTGEALSAHRAVLDIARGPSGVPRLVTTNFDRLFEACDNALTVWHPPMLPDPHRGKGLEGIIHLHGVVDEHYQYAVDGEFVLSMADFGRAYLAEGWATDYLRRLMERFTIVFIGYTAEDPPIKYLLEALNRFGRGKRQLYAFQSDDEQGGMDRWRQKGVQPIKYEHNDRHAALWDTLEKWAERARDVEAWHQWLIKLARQGPETLQPHERGMVAHLVSHVEGAKRLQRAGSDLPPQWLMVLDSDMRYRTPERLPSESSETLFGDHFEAFGLDSDPEPEIPDPDELWPKRKTPESVWDGLVLNDNDRHALANTLSISVHLNQAAAQDILPERLHALVHWIVGVAHYPVTLWWAAGKDDLHPYLLDRIGYALRHQSGRFAEPMARGWQTLLHARQQRLPVPDQAYHEIEMLTRSGGWTPSLIREAMALYRPCTKVRPIGRMPDISASMDDPLSENVIHVSVEFLQPYREFEITDAHVRYAASLFRSHIEDWLRLHNEYSSASYIFLHSSMTLPEKGSDTSGFSGIDGHLNLYAELLEQLAGLDAAAARNEILLWPINESVVFDRIRIWAAGVPEINSPEETAQVLLGLSEENFWSNQHQPNLLNTIRQRWTDLSQHHKSALEQRLLVGANPWPDKNGHDVDQLDARLRLGRLYWLSTGGVQFSFDINCEMARLREIDSEWKEDSGINAVSDNMGVGSLALDTSCQKLDELPLEQILVPERDNESLDIPNGVNHQPFLGLANEKPVKALAALVNAARRDHYPRDAWSFMLQADAPRMSTDRMLKAVGIRLAGLPAEALDDMAAMVARWLRKNAVAIFTSCPELFDRIWNALIHVLTRRPVDTSYRRPGKSWIDEAINRPAGQMAEATLENPDLEHTSPETGLPESLKRHLHALLALDERMAAQAAVIASSRLSWLYNTDPEWCEGALLEAACHDGLIREAVFEGLLIGRYAPEPSLFLRLQDDLISVTAAGEEHRQIIQRLAGFVLIHWGNTTVNDTSAVNAHGQLLVTSRGFREILIQASETYRLATLDHLLRFAHESFEWQSHIVPFLKDVWPRQVRVRTDQAAGRLAGLTLAAPIDEFPAIVDLMARGLKQVKGGLYRLSPPGMDSLVHARQHPRALLELLAIVLTDDVYMWPSGVTDWLHELPNQPAVAGDERLNRFHRLASLGE